MNDYKGVLEKHSVLTFTPGGNSMWPFIKDGKSSVIVERLEKPEKYDVILYDRNDSRTVFHRVLGIDGDSLIVCGDNQYVAERVNVSQAYGVMKGFYSGEKYVDKRSKGYLFAVRIWCASLKVRKLIIIAHNHFLKAKNN